MNKELFDRLLLFLSADFFVAYWHHLTGHHFTAQQQEIVQRAARAEVDAFIAGERSFWDIDFSEERQNRSMASFFRRASPLGADALVELNKLAFSFCADKQEGANITFALGFLHQMATSIQFTLESGLSRASHDLIAACIEGSKPNLLDTFEVQRAWLQAEGAWDQKIQRLTPDLPEYIALNFAECYRRDRELPALIENLSVLLDSKQHKTLLSELGDAMSKQFPPDSDLSVPRLLS